MKKKVIKFTPKTVTKNSRPINSPSKTVNLNARNTTRMVNDLSSLLKR